MKKIFALTLVAGLLWGCATLSRPYRQGNQAEMNRMWDEAIRYYEKAALESPTESVYRLALMRVRTSASLALLQEARALAEQDKRDEAVAAYKKALSYDPMNRALLAELEVFAAGPQALPREKAEERPVEAPIKLKVSAEKVQLKFAEAALRSIFQALGKHAGVNFLYDEQFRDVPLTIDLTDRTFEQAVGFLCLASKNFPRTIDEKTVIIVPDQPMKRLQYELNAIRTFYLSNINVQEVQNSLAMMIRTQYKAPSIIIDKNLNSITIRDTPTAVNLAGKLLRTWDKSKGEVIIDLEIMEVSRIKMRKFGIDLNQNSISGRYSGAGAVPTDGWFGLKDIDLSKGTNFQISLPTAYLNFLQTDADTKIIAQPRLRGVGSEDIKYMVGQKVPVPQTTFTPFAAGGVSQQPIVNYNYQDVGIDVKIRPRIHAEREVTLELEIKITSIAGAGIADIPIITTREVKNVIRLKDGEANLLAGLLKDEERRSLKGITGLSDIPILGNLFSSTETNIDQTDVILTITPYIIRTVSLTEEDSKPLWVDVEGLSGSGGGDARPIDEEYVGEAEAEPVAEEEEAGRSFIVLNPANFEVPKGREFRISVEVRSEAEIGSLTVNLGFNPQTARLKDVSEGGLGRQLGQKVPFLKNIDNSSGACTIGLSSPTPGKGIKGGGILAVLVFESVAPGEGAITVTGVTANGATGEPIQFESNESQVTVR
jgi:general secretion pathway protein D